MAKEIKFDLEYREKGEKKIFPLSIDFVSNWCIREFNAIMQITFDVKNKWDEISDLNSEIAALRTEKTKDWKDQIKTKQDEIFTLSHAILAYNNNDILQRRFELVKQLLEDNGYKQEFLFEYDFWDRQVDPDIMIQFLTNCVWKDIDKKKVQ